MIVVGFALMAVPMLASPARAEEQVLLALGDSLTQGYGLEQGDGLVPQLEGWLRDHGHEVRVINGGVSGDTSAGGLSRVAWSLTPEVDAVMVALGGNDLLRGIDPADTRANLDGILEQVQGRGLPVLLVGMQAPGNFGAEYKARFDAIYPELAEARGALLLPSLMAPVLGDPAAPDLAGAAKWLQADGIHPNAEGVTRIVAALGPEVEALLAQAGQ